MKKVVIAVLLFMILGGIVAFTVLISAPTTINDFFLPGSQPMESGTFTAPGNCANCHGDYDTDVEPYAMWHGSMMAQAARDPLFYAALAIANQDAPESGDYCLRCHAPTGWLEGRSTEPNGGLLTPDDREGVHCHFCHRMMKTFEPGTNPYPLDSIYTDETYEADSTYIEIIDSVPSYIANGMFVVSDEDVRRGPYADPEANHATYYSPYFRESALCGTCHDVSNPAFNRVTGSFVDFVPNAFDEAHPTYNPHDMVPIERTYSEWLMSAYNSDVGISGSPFGGNKDAVSTCQDCHMRDVTGKGCNKNRAPVRDDLGIHDLMGGNTFVPKIVAAAFPGEGVDQAHQDSAISRAYFMLENAATMSLEFDPATLTASVKVINETGHKLPTGYPEGRRMWLYIRSTALMDTIVYESGKYDLDSASLTQDVDIKIYQVKPGISHSLAPIVGEPAGPSFHFVLNDTIYFDNRIPPRGFTNANFDSVLAQPIAYNYADSQYWDITDYILPAYPDTIETILYYQTTTKEYVDFLQQENTTNFWGDTLKSLWENNGKSEPVVMQRVLWTAPTCIDTLYLGMISPMDSVYLGAKTIVADSTFIYSPSHIIFETGMDVLLRNGFQVDSGGVFETRVVPCILIDE